MYVPSVPRRDKLVKAHNPRSRPSSIPISDISAFVYLKQIGRQRHLLGAGDPPSPPGRLSCFGGMTVLTGWKVLVRRPAIPVAWAVWVGFCCPTDHGMGSPVWHGWISSGLKDVR